MIKLKEVMIQGMPDYFYHATYKELLPSIKQYGLDPSKGSSNWDDSKPDVVYLSNDPYVAESYAEEAEEVPDDWIDEIIILKIKSSNLDSLKIHDDENVISDEPSDTFEYYGIITWNIIEIYND